MARLILLLALLAIAYLLYQWISNTPREKLVEAARKYGLWIVGGLLLLMVLTGRMHWLYAMIAAAVPLVQRAFGLLRLLPMFRQVMAVLGLSGSAAAGAGAGQGQRSSIRTRFLDLSLDHASGDMDGQILEGGFAGQRLSELTWEQLTQLLGELQADPQSQRVLEAYLQRMHHEQWQQYDHSDSDARGATGDAGSSAMSNEEAAAILGVSNGAGVDEIRAAHRSLIQKLHPDRGGSAWLAARVNKAKDILMRQHNA